MLDEADGSEWSPALFASCDSEGRPECESRERSFGSSDMV